MPTRPAAFSTVSLKQVESAPVNLAGETVKVTLSLGIASTEAFGYDLDRLMRRADMAVYAAKRQGRNKVLVAEAEGGIESPKVVTLVAGARHASLKK